MEDIKIIEKAEYYIHEYKKYKIDLETLHKKLYNLFGSYKVAVCWLADNWQ